MLSVMTVAYRARSWRFQQAVNLGFELSPESTGLRPPRWSEPLARVAKGGVAGAVPVELCGQVDRSEGGRRHQLRVVCQASAWRTACPARSRPRHWSAQRVVTRAAASGTTREGGRICQ